MGDSTVRSPDPVADYASVQTPRGEAPFKSIPTRLASDSTSSPNSTKSSPSSTSSKGLAPLSALFKYADSTDKWLMSLGAVAAAAAGVTQPLQIILWGDVINSFNPSTSVTANVLQRDIDHVALRFVYVGIAALVCCFLQAALWSITAARQAKRIRSAYVQAILRMEIGWFDVNEPMQLSTRVADTTVAMQDGMGRKVGDGINFLVMGISGVVIGLVKGWQLALVLLAFVPFIGGTAYLAMRVLAKATQAGIDSYGQAGAIAQEALGNIRTVHMFNAVDHFITKYGAALGISLEAGVKKGVAIGWGTGLMFFTMFCTYACGMWYGALRIANDREVGCTGSGCYDGGRVLTVFFGIIMGAMALGQAGPSAQAIYSARAAAYDVFDVIHRQSLIDPLAKEGTKPTTVSGNIEISNVTFSYPTRPDVKVCSDYSLKIKAGETVALVGESGSGKSTIVSLLERFYDPQAGHVLIDDIDVRELNVHWLRSKIGLVGQEPSLFATSIMENIRYGRPDATDADVLEAAKMANAFDFIMTFPQGFETEVGEFGAQLSGGQKQRIAIARAIIKNPPILLLDEATSALDTESERVVQESLDHLLSTSHRTTIIIAHRLSTIRNADKIAVHKAGAIVELGTHDELMQIENGHYRALVETQSRQLEQRVDEHRLVHVPTRSGSFSSASFRYSHASSKDIIEDAVLANDENGKKIPPVSTRRIWMMSVPEWRYLLLGSSGAIVNAATFPIWGVVFSKITNVFFSQKDKHDMMHSARLWAVGFLCLGVIFGVSIILQHFSFAVVAQRLVSRVRLAVFSSMLRQEVGWFDLDENSSGALVSRLATDSATLQAMTSDTLNQGLVNLTSMGIALGIAFFYSWQMTLLVLAVSPLMMFTQYVQAQQMQGTLSNHKSNDADSSAGALLSEAIGSIRTVASLGSEQGIHASYELFLSASRTVDNRQGLLAGVGYSVSQGVMFFTLALLFHFGGVWVSRGTIKFEDMFLVISVIMLSTFAVGMAAQNMTDQNKAKMAAHRVLSIIDRRPAIDATCRSGDILPQVRGELQFNSVSFSYPARPNASIYTDYKLKIRPGQTVALVGASGSGKSTAISLLERFYDPNGGSVTLDGVDLRKLQLPWLRERISLVSQEPVLFAGTIADNIAMGKPGATRDEIEEAAKKANAFEFISNFPNTFDTDVGDRGAQVSGGQKQRIAIARAILRDPDVLLLDEATSALDNTSERIVQESLDHLLAQKKRTTVIVAHRLSTIRHADLIAVTQDGAIVEQGTHDELMTKPNGVYQALVASQLAVT